MNRTRNLLLAILILAVAAPVAVAGQAEEITPDELQQRIEDGSAPLILDVRRPDEFAEGHLPGAMHIPYDELADRLEEMGIELDEEVVVYCRSGRRAGVAESVLHEAGYTNIRDLEGHWLGWSEAGRPSESDESS
ncbi:MAG: rhodanese-like domain-containing protein [Acidobacteria bacterium]|nr:rhodanese-like domain-containing protein [Acidobacteriota bacterium]